MDAKQYGNRPAFPHAAMTEQVTVPTQHPGITVRDLFAGLALQGYLSNPETFGRQEAAAYWATLRADELCAELAGGA